MDRNTMLGRLWPSEDGSYRCIVGIKNKIPRHFWFTNTEDALRKADELDQQGFDVYFTPSRFDRSKVELLQTQTNPATERPYTGRAQEAANAVNSLWLDLDWGADKPYPDGSAASAALVQWLTDTGFPQPSYIVATGHGLHVYWLLDHDYAPGEWLPVAQHLKQACITRGLAIDPSRSADSASLLRVPGTRNRKDDAPFEVRVSGSDAAWSLDELRGRLPPIGPQRTAPSPAGKEPESEWDPGRDLPPGDADAIAKKCRQMGTARMVGCNGISEPYWRAVLSVLYRCHDGERLIHEWSQGDPRYDPQETNLKAAGTKGPATCAYFDESNPGGCEGCPLRGKITSPVQASIKVEPVAQQAAPGAEPSGEPVALWNYKVGKTGVWFEPKDEDPIPLTSIPIWLEQVRVNATDAARSSLQIAWNDTFGRYYCRGLDQRDLFDNKQFTAWLADNNLRAFTYEVPQLMHYISKLTAEHYRLRGKTDVYEAMGWYDDFTRFVLGAKAISAEGLNDVVVDNSSGIGKLEQKGSVDAWSEATAVLARPEYYCQAFAVLVALGSPLLHMTNRDGCVVALVGDSGYGKTLAAKMGLSAFYDPERVMENGTSTNTAIELRSGAHRHTPILIDEVTTVPTKRLMDLIYMAANGKGKASATRNRSLRNTENWKLVTFFTSNHSLVDRSQAEVEEAHRRRLLELPVRDALTKADSATLVHCMRWNYGIAAAPFIQALINYREQIPELFDVVEKWVEQQSQAGDKNRFVTWSLAAALLAGVIARSTGIIRFDPLPVVLKVIERTSKDYRAIQAAPERALEVLHDWLTENSRRICRWQRRGFGEDVDAPIARITGGTLYIHARSLNKAWAEEHINKASMDDWLESVLTEERTSKVRLSPNSPSAVYCYAFDVEKLGIDPTVIVDRNAE